MVHKFSRRTDKIERFIEYLSCAVMEFSFMNKIYSTQPFSMMFKVFFLIFPS